MKLELDMSTYSQKKIVDIIEGAIAGERFIQIAMLYPHDTTNSDEFVISFTSKDGKLHKHTVVAVTISEKMAGRE